ncbi:putative acetyltransferase [compost metagenome]
MLIRPVRFPDLPALRSLVSDAIAEAREQRGVDLASQFPHWHQMSPLLRPSSRSDRLSGARGAIYPLARVLTLFPNPYQNAFNLHVAEANGEVAGFIQTAPANRDQSRWHVDYLAVRPDARGQGIAQALLDYTFEHHLGVKSFTVEIDTRNLAAIGLFTRKGFRRYATVHYFQLPEEKLKGFESVQPPPGLRPYRAKDAAGLLQLHNACTPSPMRMIDARNVGDFEVGLVQRTLGKWRCKLGMAEEMRYVVTDERQRMIGYLHLTAQLRSDPHAIDLLVHPGYDDLAEPLLRFGLSKLREYPLQGVLAWVPDYQPAKMGALEQAGFSLLTAHHLFVRDSLLTIRMPSRSVAAAEDNAFKPAFYEPCAGEG